MNRFTLFIANHGRTLDQVLATIVMVAVLIAVALV